MKDIPKVLKKKVALRLILWKIRAPHQDSINIIMKKNAKN